MRKIKFVKGNYYHIFNRGVEKRNIFNNDSDKWRFLQGMFLFNDEDISSNLLFRLEKEKRKMSFGVLKDFFKEQKREKKQLIRILADCLMPNHYHLLVEEIQENGVSRFMHKLGVGYTKYFNTKYERVGSLFQGTFKAAAIEKDLYLQYLLVYINVINPGQLIDPELKEKGEMIDINKILNFAENYSWSTHQDYLGKRKSTIIDKGIFNNFFPESIKYQNFVRDILLGKQYKKIDDLLFE